MFMFSSSISDVKNKLCVCSHRPSDFFLSSELPEALYNLSISVLEAAIQNK